MVCGTFKINGVTDSEVTGVVARFWANVPPPIKVTPTMNADGTWTVTATFPPCSETVTDNADVA